MFVLNKKNEKYIIDQKKIIIHFIEFEVDL